MGGGGRRPEEVKTTKAQNLSMFLTSPPTPLLTERGVKMKKVKLN